VRILSILFI